MKDFISQYGKCSLDKHGNFFVDGKKKFEGVICVSYMSYKRDTHVYIHFKRGVYKLYSLKERKVLLNNFSKIIYKAKCFVVVTFEEDNKERYYLHHFIDEMQSRYIIKQIGHVILEEDGITLTPTKPSYSPLTLPKKCIDLCESKSIINFYAISEDNEIFVLAPYPYNFNDDFLPSKTIFWKFNQYEKYKLLKKLPFKALKDYIIFKSEEERKIFALVSILYKYKSTIEKIFISNIKNVLTDNQIKFKHGIFNITLTLDEIIIQDKTNETKYTYDVFKYDDSYLQNLIQYHLVKNMDAKIKIFINKKLKIDEIENSTYFHGNKDLLKKYLYNLNCNPNSQIFYVINNENRIIMANRQKLVERIKDSLLSGKNFASLMNRYDLKPDIIRKMIKENYLEEYHKLKNNNSFNND